ncbi:hypothetical protein ETK69_01120 [Bacillus velezensis]|nr:hypothetical protein ETK69_01120 [Bacillus velezensis]
MSLSYDKPQLKKVPILSPILSAFYRVFVGFLSLIKKTALRLFRALSRYCRWPVFSPDKTYLFSGRAQS